MNVSDFYSNIITNAPPNLIQLGDDNHAQNMANFSTLVNANMPPIQDINTLPNDGGGGNKNPSNDLQFGDWTGTNGDTKAMAKDLMNRGMTGSDQIYFQTPDTSTRDGVTKSRSDVIPAAISQILQNAHNLGIRDSTTALANKNVLLSSPLFKDTVNNPNFKLIYPNFWDIVTKSILPEQWAKYDKTQVLKNATASK